MYIWCWDHAWWHGFYLYGPNVVSSLFKNLPAVNFCMRAGIERPVYPNLTDISDISIAYTKGQEQLIAYN